MLCNKSPAFHSPLNLSVVFNKMRSIHFIRNKLLLYADDSVILVSDKDSRVVSQALSNDLRSCNNWLIDNELSLHVGKTECILFGSHARLKKASDFNIMYNGQTICSQDSINYLGVTIDQTLSNMIDG